MRAASPMTVTSRFEASVTRDRKLLAQARELYGAVDDPASAPRFEPDPFDARCEHLVVLDEDRLVGACRVLPPGNVKDSRYRAEQIFDMALLIVLRDRMVEIDRPAVHPAYSFDLVVRHLWSALARYLIANRYDHVFTTAGIRLIDGGHEAASMHRMALLRFRPPEDYIVYPRERLPLEGLSIGRTLTMPPLFSSLLEQGAWVCGEPALVRDHGCADFPLLLPLARMQGREARDFVEKAS
jgi:putative hemolysin